MSDDSHEDLPWWKERLSEWEDAGYDVTEMEKSLVAKPEFASVQLIEFERKVIEASELIVRVQSPMPGEEMRYEAWGDRLANPLSVDNVREEIDSWSRTHRPWEVAAWKNTNSWEDAGVKNELVEIVERLDDLDKSSIPQAELFLDMFENPSQFKTLEARISELENAEEKRMETISRAIDSLEDEGIIIGKMGALDVLEQLKMIDELHELVSKQRKVRVLIENEVFPFDQELAESIDEKRRHMLTLEHRKELDELEEKIVSISENYKMRLSQVNHTIASWRNEGIILPHSDLVRPEELIEWEVNLGEIEQMVEINRDARGRLQRIAQLWPDENLPSYDEVMTLENTEEIVDIVESLEQRWQEIELASLDIIEGLEKDGFQMQHWRHRVSEEPRTALKWLQSEGIFFERARRIIRGLESIDSSIEGEQEISDRISSLREIELDDSILGEMEEFLDIRAKRGARHRMMLEREWRELCEVGKADFAEPTAKWSLSRFEEEVSAAKTGSRVETSVERLLRRTRHEISEWSRDGWNISELLELIEDDALGVGKMMPILRKEIGRYDQLIGRLENLPWGNDVSMAEQILVDLPYPNRLTELWNSIPDIANKLAGSKQNNPEFVWKPWKPGGAERRVLVPIPEQLEIPTLVPTHIPADPHEEMLEATLEEMEKVVQPDELDDDLIPDSVSVEKDIFEPVIEKEPVPLPPFLDEDKESENTAETIDRNNVAPVVELSLEPLSSLLGVLGITQEKQPEQKQELLISLIRRQLAGNVGIEPRDTRVDRLLRLLIRCLPKQEPQDVQRMELIRSLDLCARQLSKWTRSRLIARHSTPRGGLLLNSEILGVALERIPGPGHHLPLKADDYQLPDDDDFEGLASEINNLLQYSTIPTSGGIKAA